MITSCNFCRILPLVASLGFELINHLLENGDGKETELVILRDEPRVH